MKSSFTKIAFTLLTGLLIVACSKDDNPEPIAEVKVDKKQVIETYANIAFANYTKAYEDAVILETAINTFTTNPNLVNFNNAKEKWILSRESYGTTEAFRFAKGPIDSDIGPEGLINSWPMDENFVDYVDGSPNAGIINDLVGFPTISKTILVDQNALDIDEKNVSVGYHAIEFLLWGQDLTAPSLNKPGQRPYTDYLTTSSGTATNQVRRATYLKVCADLLTDNLLDMVNEWKIGGDYRNTFLGLAENVALKNMYLGITTLISSELPNERMETGLELTLQEEEHSCFSDNTHRDIILNLQGVVNVYQGKYGSIDGASLEDLVSQTNKDVATETNISMNESVTKANAILNPFDLAISGGVNSIEGAKVKTALLQFRNFGANLLNGAAKIGITVN